MELAIVLVKLDKHNKQHFFEHILLNQSLHITHRSTLMQYDLNEIFSLQIYFTKVHEFEVMLADLMIKVVLNSNSSHTLYRRFGSHSHRNIIIIGGAVKGQLSNM